MNDEIKASGISPEMTDLDKMMAETLDMEESSSSIETEVEERKKSNEKKKADDIRMKAMETLSETKKRKQAISVEDDDDEEHEPDVKPIKRVRRNGSDTITFLKEQNEQEMSLRKEDMALRVD
ncbi:hypothetical protein QZH41_001299 [Actinostola sp. cb2023]|nr:hypothetical protein QZH41_001299 [Actinostola sp. cb2023]